VGRLAPQKDPVALVRATALMEHDAELVLVGDGPLRGEVERAARELGVNERVRLVGGVHRSHVASHLATADIFALPSTYEELGTAIVEAMAAGLPVVATHTGGIPTLVRDDAGVLVPPGDPQQLARALDRLIGDADLARRLGEGGRRTAAGYRWDVLARRVHTVYGQALGRRDEERPNRGERRR
jgi:glycogen(starch) synthase